MDLSHIQTAMVSKSYGKIAELCDQLMLQVASNGIFFQEEWPYTIHLLGHIYVNDLNSARFLWKSMPMAIKESRPEVVAVWKIGQCLWKRDYAGVYSAVREFEWSPEVLEFVTTFLENYTRRMFQLLVSGYSTISVADTAHFLGMSEGDAINFAVEHGWLLDSSSQMLTVTKQITISKQKPDPANLHRLTEYVFQLEH